MRGLTPRAGSVHMSYIMQVPSDFADRAREAKPEDQLKILRQQIGNLLLERVKELSEESLKVHSDMESILSRLLWHAEAADVGDIRTANWHRTKTEISILQHVAKLIAIIQNEAPGVPAEVVKI